MKKSRLFLSSTAILAAALLSGGANASQIPENVRERMEVASAQQADEEVAVPDLTISSAEQQALFAAHSSHQSHSSHSSHASHSSHSSHVSGNYSG